METVLHTGLCFVLIIQGFCYDPGFYGFIEPRVFSKSLKEVSVHEQEIRLVDEDRCFCECNFGDDSDGENICTWSLVFKAVAGNGRFVVDDFLNGGDQNMGVEGSADIHSDLPYRNRLILDRWNQQIIEKVQIELFTAEGKRIVWFLFDAEGAGIGDWMSKDRLMASSYSSIQDDFLDNCYIQRNDSSRRYFFINKHVGNDCGEDCGYLAVIDDSEGKPKCGWQETHASPYFLYGRYANRCSLWSGESHVAERFVVSVKTCEI